MFGSNHAGFWQCVDKSAPLTGISTSPGSITLKSYSFVCSIDQGTGLLLFDVQITSAVPIKYCSPTVIKESVFSLIDVVKLSKINLISEIYIATGSKKKNLNLFII